MSEFRARLMRVNGKQLTFDNNVTLSVRYDKLIDFATVNLKQFLDVTVKSGKITELKVSEPL